MSLATAESEAPPAAAALRKSTALSDLAELVKARLTFLVLLTTAVGFFLGWRGPMNFAALFHAVIGTAFAAGGAAALNQWWERDFDAAMTRTQGRPLPAGRVGARDAILIGSLLSLGGVVYLWIACNVLSAALALATILIYIFAYTPLKRISTLNTLVGAVPGALPPMVGWAAARGDLAAPAWSLFAILFCWQLPHFLAIAWIYRRDYAQAGFIMLSGHDATGALSGRQAILFSALLIPASMAPGWQGLASGCFQLVALLLGLGFLTLAVRFSRGKSRSEARQLFIGSIIYLPLLLGALVLTKA